MKLRKNLLAALLTGLLALTGVACASDDGDTEETDAGTEAITEEVITEAATEATS